MKKQIYLSDQYYRSRLFEYEDLQEIAEKFNLYTINQGNRATIGNAIKLLTGFYINGTVHTVTYTGNSMLCIGCHCRSIAGRKEKYEAEQIAEYYNYILMAEMFHNANYSEVK